MRSNRVRLYLHLITYIYLAVIPKKLPIGIAKMLGGTIEKMKYIRDAPSINVRLGSLQLITEAKGLASPSTPNGIKHFDKFSSHNEWGMDHFAFIYNGDLKIYCEELRNKGVSFNVEPWEFLPGVSICYGGSP